MLGLIVTERDKDRAFLATRTGLEAIALERGDKVELTRLSFQVAPDTDFRRFARELSEHGIKSETAQRHFARRGAGAGVHRPQGHGDRALFRIRVRQGRRQAGRHHAAQARPRRASRRRRAEDGEVLHRRARLPGVGLARRLSSRSCAAASIITPSISSTTRSRSSTTSPSRCGTGRSCTAPATSSRRNEIQLVWGPGRHIIGHNVAAYHRNSDNVRVELYLRDGPDDATRRSAISIRGRGTRTARNIRRSGRRTRCATTGASARTARSRAIREPPSHPASADLIHALREMRQHRADRYAKGQAVASADREPRMRCECYNCGRSLMERAARI